MLEWMAWVRLQVNEGEKLVWSPMITASLRYTQALVVWLALGMVGALSCPALVGYEGDCAFSKLRLY
jgi:hypothetical protein